MLPPRSHQRRFGCHLILFRHSLTRFISVLLSLSELFIYLFFFREPSVCHISKKGSIWHDVASALGVSLPLPPVVLVCVRSLKLLLHVRSGVFHQRAVKRSQLYNCLAWRFTAYWSQEINQPVSPTLPPLSLRTPVPSYGTICNFFSFFLFPRLPMIVI